MESPSSKIGHVDDNFDDYEKEEGDKGGGNGRE